jgi:hypothetical protein
VEERRGKDDKRAGNDPAQDKQVQERGVQCAKHGILLKMTIDKIAIDKRAIDKMAIDSIGMD